MVGAGNAIVGERQHVAGRGRLLSLGRSCIRALWGFQNGWLTWMYSLVDMAIYPVLFNQYLRYFIPGLDPRLESLISLAIIWGAAWINVRGSVNVSRTSIVAGCFVMLGFLALSIRQCAANHSRSVATVRVGTRSRTRRFGRRYLDCALELHRLG